MKYEVGDKIVVLHSNEEGTVVDIINEKMVLIDVRGVKFPAYMDQIDFPYFNMFFKPKEKVVSKKKIYVDDVKQEKQLKRQKTEDGVYISIIPVFSRDVFDDDIVEYLKIYLVNHNEEAYQFNYNLFFGNEESAFALTGSIEGLAELYLHDVDFDDISDNPRFEFLFSLKKPDKKKATEFEASVKLNGKKIFKRIQDLIAKHEANFRENVFMHYPDKPERDSRIDLSRLAGVGKVIDAGKARDYLPPARTVLDIHIEKLVENPAKLSSSEMLDIQLREFEKYYDLAVAHHLPKFVVIHGVGSGTLKKEIHEALKHKKEVKSYHNLLTGQFGAGATEIYFK